MSKKSTQLVRRGLAFRPLVAVIAVGILGGVTYALLHSQAATTTPITKVLWIMEENHSEPQIMTSPDTPYIQSLAHTYGLATHVNNEIDPSEGNYFALLAGDTYGVADDSPPGQHQLHGQTIFGQFPAGQAMTFSETMPTNCALTDGPKTDINHAGVYAVHHSGWPYFVDASERNLCNQYMVNLQNNFQSKINSGLPKFTEVAPANCNEMHHGTLPASSDICVFDSTTGPTLESRGDWWLKTWIPKIMAGPDYQAGNLAIFIVWDEGAGPGDTAGMDCTNSTLEACHPGVIVISPNTHAVVDATHYTHYSVLRTTEELLGVPLLGHAADWPSMATRFGLTGCVSNCSSPSPSVSPSLSPSPSSSPSPSPSPTGDTIKPTVSLTAPVDNATISTNSVSLSYTASDNVGVTRIDLVVDTVVSNTLPLTSPYTLDVSQLAAGSHTLKLRAYDAAGNFGATTAITINIIHPTVSPSPTSTLSSVGDVNGDSKINVTDLSLLNSHWGTNYPSADFNHDGTVGIIDLSILLSHWTG